MGLEASGPETEAVSGAGSETGLGPGSDAKGPAGVRQAWSSSRMGPLEAASQQAVLKPRARALLQARRA